MANDLAKQFAAAYTAALPGRLEDIKEKAEVHPNMTLAGLDLGDAKNTICDAWPGVKKMLKWALRAAAWFFPTETAQAKAIIDALEKTIIPAVCGKVKDNITNNA